MTIIGRWARGLLGVLVLVLATSGALPGNRVADASACGCVTDQLSEMLGVANVVARGKVTAADPPRGERSSMDEIRYTVELTRIWLGDPSNPAEVRTRADRASCGVPNLRVGDDVVIAGDQRHSYVRINSCGGSGTAAPERLGAVEAAFGAGSPAAPPELRDAGPTVAIQIGVAAAVVAAAGAAVLVARRRRRASVGE